MAKSENKLPPSIFVNNIEGIACNKVIKNGRVCYEAPTTPHYDKRPAIAEALPDMPGIIILVHGVNSQGEWYDEVEKGLIDGLNKRLGLSIEKKLEMKHRKMNNPKLDKGADPTRVKHNPDQHNRSPVIHFHWGYRSPDGREKDYLIPLQDREYHSAWSKTEKATPPLYWGGGPFQNGCNNLPLMWSTGFSRTLGLIDLQDFNPEVDRQLQDSPSRTYFTHAAKRLAKLIETIREKYPQDTITIIGHSQGTMVAMAAIFMAPKRMIDCLMILNSPFALEHKMTGGLQHGGNTATDEARLQTFKNLLAIIQGQQRKLNESQLEKLRVGVHIQQGKRTIWRPDQVENERDNHGRVYVYFNPHDRVMGSESMQSIGWSGIPSAIIEQYPGLLYQRMLARNTACGDTPGEYYLWPRDKDGKLKPFWSAKGVDIDGNPLDGNRSAPFQIWANPPEEDYKVMINAEKVPNPIDKSEVANFDELRDTEDENKAWPKVEEKFQFYQDIYQRIYQDGEMDQEVVIDGEGEDDEPDRVLESQTELEKRLNKYIPEPTDHSTLPQHLAFLSRVVAYDLPIGPCNSHHDINFWNQLVKDADWLESDDYFKTGQFSTPAMPTGIVNETFDDWDQYDGD